MLGYKISRNPQKVADTIENELCEHLSLGLIPYRIEPGEKGILSGTIFTIHFDIPGSRQVSVTFPVQRWHMWETTWFIVNYSAKLDIQIDGDLLFDSRLLINNRELSNKAKSGSIISIDTDIFSSAIKGSKLTLEKLLESNLLTDILRFIGANNSNSGYLFRKYGNIIVRHYSWFSLKSNGSDSIFTISTTLPSKFGYTQENAFHNTQEFLKLIDSIEKSPVWKKNLSILSGSDLEVNHYIDPIKIDNSDFTKNETVLESTTNSTQSKIDSDEEVLLTGCAEDTISEILGSSTKADSTVQDVSATTISEDKIPFFSEKTQPYAPQTTLPKDTDKPTQPQFTVSKTFQIENNFYEYEAKGSINSSKVYLYCFAGNFIICLIIYIINISYSSSDDHFTIGLVPEFIFLAIILLIIQSIIYYLFKLLIKTAYFLFSRKNSELFLKNNWHKFYFGIVIGIWTVILLAFYFLTYSSLTPPEAVTLQTEKNILIPGTNSSTQTGKAKVAISPPNSSWFDAFGVNSTGSQFATVIKTVDKSTSTSDDSVSVWDESTGQVTATFPLIKNTGDVGCPKIAISPKAQLVAVGCRSDDKNQIHLYNISTKVALSTIQTNYSPSSMNFSTDENKLIISSGGEIKVWSVYDAKLIAQLGEGIFDNSGESKKYSSGSIKYALNPAQASQIAVADGNKIVLANLLNGSKIKQFEGKNSSVLGLTFSPDGKTLAASFGDAREEKNSSLGEIIFWDVDTGEIKKSIKTYDYSDKYAIFKKNYFPLYYADDLHYTADGSKLFGTIYTPAELSYGKSNNAISVWNPQSGQEILESNNLDTRDLQLAAVGKNILILSYSDTYDSDYRRSIKIKTLKIN